MTIKVAYLSKTGHSRKIARAIAEALQTEPIDIRTAPAPAEADLLFLVGGIYGGQSLPEMLSYAEMLRPELVRRVALVTSCAGMTARQQAVRQKLEDNGVGVLADEFVCPGSFLFMRFRHPNPSDLRQAADFALRTVEKEAK